MYIIPEIGLGPATVELELLQVWYGIGEQCASSFQMLIAYQIGSQIANKLWHCRTKIINTAYHVYEKAALHMIGI